MMMTLAREAKKGKDKRKGKGKGKLLQASDDVPMAPREMQMPEARRPQQQQPLHFRRQPSNLFLQLA